MFMSLGALAHEDGTDHLEPTESEAQACMGAREEAACSVGGRGGACLPASCRAGEGTPPATNSAGYYDCLWCTTSIGAESSLGGGGACAAAPSDGSGLLFASTIAAVAMVLARRRR